LVTISETDPPCATAVAGSVAVMEVGLCAVTVSALPFAVTAAVVEKAVPLSVRVTAPDPASTDEGEIALRTGVG
jgi:hypothetical protein